MLCILEENSKSDRARPGFEPGTSRTLSENHTPRPTSQLVKTVSNKQINHHAAAVAISRPLGHS